MPCCAAEKSRSSSSSKAGRRTLRRRPRLAGAGYSLIELLLVVTIIGILVAIGLPSTQPTIHDRLEGAAQVLISDLAYAQSLAMAGASTYRIALDPSGAFYTLEHTGSNSALDDLPDSPFRNADAPADQHIVRFDDLPAVGGGTVRIHGAVLGGDIPTALASEIEFGELGETTSLEDTTIWLTSGSGDAQRFQAVEVNGKTGLASLGPFQATAPPFGG